MRKIVLLLILAVALAGVVFAGDTAYPPWVLTFEAELPGYGVDGLVVTPDSVLVSAMPMAAELSSIQAVMALYIDLAIRPQTGIMNIPSLLLNYKQALVVSAADKFYLRC